MSGAERSQRAGDAVEVRPRTGYGIEATRAWAVFIGRTLAQVFAIAAVTLVISWAGVETYDFLVGQWWTDNIDFEVSDPIEQTTFALAPSPTVKPELIERSFPNYGDMARLDGALQAREIVSEHKWLRVLLGAGAILSAHVVLMRMKSWLDA